MLWKIRVSKSDAVRVVEGFIGASDLLNNMLLFNFYLTFDQIVVGMLDALLFWICK